MSSTLSIRNAIRLILTPPPAEVLGGASIGKPNVIVIVPLA
jgi:hypothetical protein